MQALCLVFFPVVLSEAVKCSYDLCPLSSVVST